MRKPKSYLVGADVGSKGPVSGLPGVGARARKLTSPLATSRRHSLLASASRAVRLSGDHDSRYAWYPGRVLFLAKMRTGCPSYIACRYTDRSTIAFGPSPNELVIT